MQNGTDWIMLWKELVEAQSHMWKKRKPREGEEDHWRHKARSFSEAVKQRWAHPDSHRDFILSLVKSLSRSTVLDIGAGTGGWAVPLAMRENLESEGVDNVEIIQGPWPESEMEAHDFSLCSHAMYGCSDLTAFVHAMTKATRRTCFMLMRMKILRNGRISVSLKAGMLSYRLPSQV